MIQQDSFSVKTCEVHNPEIISEKHWASFLQKAPELQKEKQIQFDGQTKNHQLIRLQEEVHQLQNDQGLIFDTLRKQLKTSDYKKLLDQLQKSGFVVR